MIEVTMPLYEASCPVCGQNDADMVVGPCPDMDTVTHGGPREFHFLCKPCGQVFSAFEWDMSLNPIAGSPSINCLFSKRVNVTGGILLHALGVQDRD